MMTTEDSDSPILVPFLKWAGGKRWLTAQYGNLLPVRFGRYIEPFLGSGAVYFHLRPLNALLADSNEELINAYAQIRSNWKKVERALQRHRRNHSEDYYYEERSRRHRVQHERAAQFIYLNRTCWNGLYRVNLHGEFNVPIGTKTGVLLPSDDFAETSSLLKNAHLVTSDFESTISKAIKGDFLFIDPPYVTRHNFNGFLKYNDKIFSWDDQERLRAAVGEAAKRGVKILITNAAHKSILKLYEGFGQHMKLERHSVLAADASNRGLTTEVAIAVNYNAGGR